MAIDWNAFCLGKDFVSRYDIGAPFVQDAYLYATNGWVAIRKRRRRANTKGRFPAMEYLPFLGQAPWHPWPDPLLDVAPPGGINVGGIKVGERAVGIKAATLIAGLPKPEWSEDPSACRHSPITFRFSGGQGVVMPLDVDWRKGMATDG